MKFDENDIWGGLIIVTAFVFKALTFIDGTTLIALVTLGGGYLFASNTKVGSGQ
jgi:hypothetical protein